MLDARIKFLSEYYSSLHGLYAVPVGLCLFLVSLWANLVTYPIRNFIFPLLATIFCLLAYLAVDWYYKRAYGEIKPTASNRRWYWLTAAGWAALAVLAFWLDVTYHLPVIFIGLLFAALFLFDRPRVAFPLNRFTAIKLVLAAAISLVSIAGLVFGRNWWDSLGARTPIIGVTMGVGLLIVLQGLVWHFFFVSSLPTREASDE
jgi:hypothetical protein